MSEFGKGTVTKREIELIRKKFIELANSFERPPQGGVNEVFGLVCRALNLPAVHRVEMILRTRLRNRGSAYYDAEVDARVDSLKIGRCGDLKARSIDVQKVKTQFVDVANDPKFKDRGVEELTAIVAERLEFRVGEVRSFIYNYLSNPKETEYYDENFVALKNDRRRKHLFTEDEVELVKLKFVEIAGSFESAPAEGLNHIYRLIAEDLGMKDSSASHIIRDCFCNPQSKIYDPAIRTLKDSLKLYQPLTPADQKQHPPAKVHKWEYSDTERILGAMETRLQEVEMASVILKKEKEDLQRENKRLQKKNDRQLSQLIERDKQFVSLREAKSEGIKDRAANVQQAGVILNHAARIEVLEEKNSEACQRIKNLLHLKGEKLALCAKQDKLLLELAKRDDKIKKLREEKDSQLRVHRETAVENKALKNQVQEQGTRIQQVESLSTERAAKIEELEKELKASKDGDTAGKKAEATFIKRWSNRFLPQAEKKPDPDTAKESEDPF